MAAAKRGRPRPAMIAPFLPRSFFIFALAASRGLSSVMATAPYLDPTLPVDQRVTDLLGRMSVEEKVGQLNQKLFGWDCYRREGERIELTAALTSEAARWGGIGTIYGLLRADPWSKITWETGIPPERRVEVLNRVQRLMLEHSRWGIPAFFSTEAPHGHMALGGTILPTAIGLGSTWNPALYQEAAHAVAAEIRLSGEHLALVSATDVARDPRWGRTEESFGEDPVLVAAMARAATLGTQGDSPADLLRPDRAGVVLKCLAGQGAGSGGHNAGAAFVGPRELREIHLPPVRAGVRAGALCFMAAYNEIDGLPCCANPALLRTLLRAEWGFHGFVMADGLALDNLKAQTGSFAAAGILGLRSGVDVGLWDEAFRTLADSVRAGRLDEKEIDRACAAVLRAKFELGLFEHPFVEDDPAALDAARRHTRDLNLQLARESLVLLRNENHVLPFSRNLKRVAVIGPNADDVYAQLGDYTPPQRDGETTTVLAGIRALLGPSVEVGYARGCANRGDDRTGLAAAVALARSAEAAIVVVGGSSNRYLGTHYAATGAAALDAESQMDCGEGVDVADLDLGDVQRELVQAIRATGMPLAIVLIEGRPHSIPWIAANCPAILCAWYPGQAGGRAVAEALFGEINPSGRLPISVPRSSAQLPVYYNHKLHGDDPYHDLPGTPQYPFGFGLSYTTFALSNLRLGADTASAARLNAGETIPLSVDIANTGPRAGAETIQVYLHGVESVITRRVRELKLFAKVELAPGERRTVTFQLGRDELAIWDPAMNFTVTPGLNALSVQGGATPTLTAELRVTD